VRVGIASLRQLGHAPYDFVNTGSRREVLQILDAAGVFVARYSAANWAGDLELESKGKREQMETSNGPPQAMALPCVIYL